ncbi:Glycosyltransferase family 4 protein OS=Stutzerimonas stutzeri OX=316 GN=N7335_02675 PE=4 SV=1 [Stutzerimonas stutzeri]
MRVLHFFKTYLPDTTGGIEQVIYQLCQGNFALGVESQVLSLSPNPEPQRLQVGNHEVVRARQDLFIASTGFSREVFALFAEAAREADLVHFHFPWPTMDVVHFMTQHRRPCVLSYHSDIIRQRTLLALYKPLMHRFLKSMDRIIVSSPNYLASSDVLPCYRDRTCAIPFGLDRQAYPPPPIERLSYWQQRLPPRFFLFVGVLRYYKGLRYLLEAIAGSDWPLVIAGAGPEESNLKEQARRLGLENIIWTGRIDDTDKTCLLRLCHAFVFPSHLRSEAFGISLLEAALHGKPMISCEIGTGTTFVNVDGATGLTVRPADSVALRQAMARLWIDTALSAELGAGAARRFEEQFTAQRMCEQTVQVYRDLLQSRIGH